MQQGKPQVEGGFLGRVGFEMDNPDKACVFERIVYSLVVLHRLWAYVSALERIGSCMRHASRDIHLIFRLRHNAQPVLDLPMFPIRGRPMWVLG